MAPFNRLVRFKDEAGEIHYAEAPEGDLLGAQLKVYAANPLESGEAVPLSQVEKKVVEILSPIPSAPIFYGVGLNYRQHALEGAQPIPQYPMIFTMPPDALAGPYEEIPVGKELRFMDYEGELTVVIGKDTKDLTPEDNPLDYVLGYTVGNDVSSRYWQMPDQSGGQHGYAKSFDKFAPIGPVLVSAGVVPDPSTLSLTTKVNGELRQSTKLDDLIFDVPTIIRHLSRGTTLRKYTTIMTGTPSGVAAFMNPPAWLKDGDTVQIEISEIGVIRNKMKFLD